ncbi:SBP-like protein [Artemisia annua]|uniref:SBP-like protein n=1 Tax=Artemisia annua TaxID=35608 RepID=A0A2U1LW71_ARTAN|nr:SBP-like protein [Artemisia annua]
MSAPMEQTRHNFFFLQEGGSTSTGYDYESVKRWTAQKKLGDGLDECDKDKKFQYLDSLGGTDKKVLRALPAVSSMWENTCNSKHSVATVKAEKYGGHDVLTHSQSVQFPNLVSMPPTLSFNRNISSKDDTPYFRKRTAKEIFRLRAN